MADTLLEKLFKKTKTKKNGKEKLSNRHLQQTVSNQTKPNWDAAIHSVDQGTAMYMQQTLLACETVTGLEIHTMLLRTRQLHIQF